jgi:hypothetical protein
MKKLKYIPIAAALFSAATMSSCNKQLEEYNPAGSTADAVWSTPAGFLTAVNAAYYEQRYWYGKEDGSMLAEAGTDIWFATGKGTYAKELFKYEAYTSAQGSTKSAWESLWRGINQCNAGIDRIDQAGFTDPNEKNMRLAELRFLRAFYYWHIVETWGGVMLRTHETDAVLLTATRSTPEQFYDLMIGDLEFAKDYLPVKWEPEYSRATKKAAMGMLARVYLYRASYGDATSWYTKARDMAKYVIDNKTALGTDLWATPADMWKVANNKRNKEGLYIISNSSTNTISSYDGNANRIHMWYVPYYTSRLGLTRSLDYDREDERRFMPTDRFLQLFNENIDARYEASFQEVWLCNKAYTWTAADAAKYGKPASIVNTVMKVGDTALVIRKNSLPGVDKSALPYILLDRDSLFNLATNDTILPYNANLYPALKKFMDPTRASADARQSYMDIFPVRFAEMYLIAAEAEFRLGNSGNAAAYINVLRTRAAKSGQVAAMQVSASDITVDFILDERARELCGEFQRWFDLKRMLKTTDGTAWMSRIKTYNPDITGILPYHMLRPVPLSELTALTNRDEFKQNPGY